MHMKKFVARAVAAGAIVLSAVAVVPSANAASATSPKVSVSATVSPAGGVGKLLCTGNGVFCLQRITPIENGSAYVSVWANTITWKGWFELRGPDGHIANSKNQTWEKGGVGTWLRDIPAGGGYVIIAWQDPASPTNIGSIAFSV